MALSQNAEFVGEIPADHEFDRPRGAALARYLAAGVTASGWQATEFDNWRDCGWSISCTKSDVSCEVVFSNSTDDRWFLQIAPDRIPGFAGRVLGRQPSAAHGDILELAKHVHQLLLERGNICEIRWRWDGYPDDNHFTPEPQEWARQSSV